MVQLQADTTRLDPVVAPFSEEDRYFSPDFDLAPDGRTPDSPPPAKRRQKHRNQSPELEDTEEMARRLLRGQSR